MLSIGFRACRLPLHTNPGSNPVQVAMFQRVDRGSHLQIVSIEPTMQIIVASYISSSKRSIVELQRLNCLVLSLFPSPAVIFHKIQILLESSGTSSTNDRRKRTRPLSICSNPAPADGGVLDQVLPICDDDFSRLQVQFYLFCARRLFTCSKGAFCSCHWDASLNCHEPSPTDDGVLDGVLCSLGDYFPTDFRFSSIRSVRRRLSTHSNGSVVLIIVPFFTFLFLIDVESDIIDEHILKLRLVLISLTIGMEHS
ncbi:hypothetical protein EJB05_51373 [Eragrostis curvula]|uniref:Uncharacterized protein n=1 Tax=Eragrostis curvula TaxID=38414 RepID=A0A5J9SVP4_9POAL|nr:hypothetical protein EJB05_51373 [Eragrostis curvula]